MLKVEGRSAALYPTRYGTLHRFQEQLIEALLDPAVGLIKLEAPVGVGKTTAIRKALEYCECPIIATFPTTILVRTQAAKIAEGALVYHWPKELYASGKAYDFSLIEYTSQSLLDLARISGCNLSGSRGELLGRLFNLSPIISGKRIILTTPDVLWLIYSGKYKHSLRLKEALSNSIVFFDEFHCYCDLKNFYKLLEKLGDGFISKVVLMSATPFMREDIVVEFQGERLDISFQEHEEGDFERRMFNHPLEVEIREANYYKRDVMLDALKSWIADIQKPAAVIFDSIFRLMHMESVLREECPDINFSRYDGLIKDSVDLADSTVVMGTSSIEVGIDMDFASLVFEGSSWTTAIQRLGRVGRRRPGQVLLLSNRSFEPYKPEEQVVSRSTFEDILREYLPDPRSDWISGELFRGDAPSFLLIDMKGKPYFYGPGIFSMYEIMEYDNYVADDRELRKILEEMGIQRADIGDALLHLALFPVAGIVRARRFRDSYIPVVSLETTEEEYVVRLKNGESFYFQKEVTYD